MEVTVRLYWLGDRTAHGVLYVVLATYLAGVLILPAVNCYVILTDDKIIIRSAWYRFYEVRTDRLRRS